MLKYPESYTFMTEEEMIYTTGGMNPVPLVALGIGVVGLAASAIGGNAAISKLSDKVRAENPEWNEKEVEKEATKQYMQTGSYLAMYAGVSLSTICIITSVMAMVVGTPTVKVDLPAFNPPVTPPNI